MDEEKPCRSHGAACPSGLRRHGNADPTRNHQHRTVHLQEQVQQVAAGLTKVYAYTKSLTSDKVPVVVTGLGKNFIARKAAEKIGVDSIIDLGNLLPKAVVATPAFGVAMMTAVNLKEKPANERSVVKVGGSLALYPEKLRPYAQN